MAKDGRGCHRHPMFLEPECSDCQIVKLMAVIKGLERENERLRRELASYKVLVAGRGEE